MEPECVICKHPLSDYGCTPFVIDLIDRLGPLKEVRIPPRCKAPVEVQDGAR